MNELKIFNKDGFGEMRTVTVDGQIHFVATDIAKVLGRKNSSDAILRHCRWVGKHDIPHLQSQRNISTL